MVKVMLDSGAFSAHSKGAEIDLGAYIEFIHDHLPLLESYVNLDVIPGGSSKLGQEESARLSWENYQAMRDAGLEPIPVYHMGERLYWLERMIGEGARRIGLGGVARVKGKIKQDWIASCFSFLSHHPQIQVHGFGLSGLPLLNNFQWDSADSITWMLSGGLGSVFVPVHGKLLSIYCQNCSGGEAKTLDHWARARNSSLEKLRKHYWDRARLNVRAMLEFELARSSKMSRQGFFQGTQPKVNHQFKFYFSMTWDKAYWYVLHHEGAKRILVSYFVLPSILSSLGRSFQSVVTEGLWVGDPPYDIRVGV